MPESSSPSTDVSPAPSAGDALGESRMSFGDHLEELRSRLIKALIGVVICAVLALVFARRILSLLLQPALVVLHSHGQRAEMLALGPPDTFTIYMKIAMLSGLIVAMPWVLYQVWQFVASGLYRHEQRFVRRFAPVSIVLFLAGVAFMYFIVLPLVLNFFVRFSLGFPMPGLNPTTLQGWLVGGPEPPVRPETSPEIQTAIPVLPGPPARAQPGDVWLDTRTNRLNVQTTHGIFGIPMERADQVAPVSSQFGLNFYVSFVLMLALAFGLAFEVPVAVVFLVATRLLTVQMLTRSRRYVILATVVIAAVITPSPDVISQILLAIPMLMLFEGGILVSRTIERKRT